MDEDIYQTFDKNLYRLGDDFSTSIDAENIGKGILYTFEKDNTLRANIIAANDNTVIDNIDFPGMAIFTGNGYGANGSIIIASNQAPTNTDNQNAGDIYLESGSGGATGNGGGVYLISGSGGTAGTSLAGNIQLEAGTGGSQGTGNKGGTIKIIAGRGGVGNNSHAGSIEITAGDAGLSGGNSNGGSVTITLGTKSGSGTNGSLVIQNGADIQSILDFESVATSTKTFTFPNTSGTIVVTGGTDLTVSDGGTGVSSFTAYAVICGGTTATGALQNVSGVGTSGQVLTSNGAGALPTWQNASGGGDMVVTRMASDMVVNTNVTITEGSGLSYADYTNGVVASADCVAKVPSGATSISSIRIAYNRQTTGNLYLKFTTKRVDMSNTPAAIQTDSSDTLTTYASGGSDNKVEWVTVPSGAYDGLTNIAANDLIGIEVYRDSNSATDTYESNWRIYAVEFTFA